MTNEPTDQAERLYQAFSELVRSYQFRDRNEVGCHGITVSQCYALELACERGPLAMKELAQELRLDVSSVTRAIDGLVARNLVERVASPGDRRVCHVRPTRSGRALHRRIRAELVEEHAQVLEGIPGGSRESIIVGVERLLAAFRRRQARQGPSRAPCE